MSQSVFVTGGAGYIGSHACKVLARAGYEPVVFDNLSRGHREAVRWGPLVEGDLADREELVAALREHRVSAVMHFAAYAYVGESVADPASCITAITSQAPSRCSRRCARSGWTRSSFRRLAPPTASRSDSDPRNRAAAPGQPVWRDQARDRAGAALVRGGLSTTVDFAALFQCRRRRPRRSRSANFTSPRRISSRWCCKPPSDNARTSTSMGPIIRPRMVQRFATTFTSRTSPRLICARSNIFTPGATARRSISGRVSGHSVREVIAAAEAVSGAGYPVARRPHDGRATLLCSSPTRASPRSNSAGAPAARTSQTIIRTAFAWHEAHAKRQSPSRLALAD